MTRASALALIVAATTIGSAREPVRLRIEGRVNAFQWIAAERSFVAVAWGATSTEGLADVYVSVSRDAGQSFGAPVRVNDQPGIARVGGELPPRVSLVTTERDPVIVVAWGAKPGTTDIRVSTSVDGGRSFSVSHALNTSGAASDRGWQATTVDRRGTVHAMWLDHRALATRPKPEHDHYGDGADMAQFSSLYYAAIPPVAPVAPAIPVAASRERELSKGVCYCCKTAVATASDGAVFAAWRHVYPGNIRDIAFTVSRDGGQSFQPPQRVSVDNWQLAGCPDDGPALAAGRDGSVHLVWPTVVKEVDPDRSRGAIFYASTRDGRQFTHRIEVPTMGSLKPSHPQIASDDAGGFVVAWDEVRDAVRRAYVRRMHINAGGNPTFGEALEVDPQGGAYPVFAATTRGVFVAWAQGTRMASEIRVKRLE